MARGWLVFIIAVLPACSVSAAFSADLQSSAKNSTNNTARPYNWTGLYVGGEAGYGASIMSGKGPLGSASGVLQGALAGGQLGYNYQIDTWVIGVEGDLSWSAIKVGAPLPG